MDPNSNTNADINADTNFNFSQKATNNPPPSNEPTPQSYRYEEGRANSKIVISEDEMEYLRNRTSKTSISLVCRFYHKKDDDKCNGRANIDLKTNTLIITQAHNHGCEKYNRAKETFKKKIYEEAIKNPEEGAKHIFENIKRAEKDRETRKITFASMKSTINRRRRTNLPRVPSSPTEFANTVNRIPILDKTKEPLLEDNLQLSESSSEVSKSDIVEPNEETTDQSNRFNAVSLPYGVREPNLSESSSETSELDNVKPNEQTEPDKEPSEQATNQSTLANAVNSAILNASPNDIGQSSQCLYATIKPFGPKRRELASKLYERVHCLPYSTRNFNEIWRKARVNPESHPDWVGIEPVHHVWDNSDKEDEDTFDFEEDITASNTDNVGTEVDPFNRVQVDQSVLAQAKQSDGILGTLMRAISKTHGTLKNNFEPI